MSQLILYRKLSNLYSQVVTLFPVYHIFADVENHDLSSPDNDQVPLTVLKRVFCKCTTTCQRNCGCKRAGLCCFTRCKCEGNCNNMPVAEDEEDVEIPRGQ